MPRGFDDAGSEEPSDQDSIGGGDEIPSSRPIPETQPEAEPDENLGADLDKDDEEEDDAEDGEDVYVVEKIREHEWRGKGKNRGLVLLVKWKGYEKEEDQTWEPEENLLLGAKDILTNYYNSIKGRPTDPVSDTNGFTKKRKSNASLRGEAESQPQKRGRKSTADEDDGETNQWLPPAHKSWEDYVEVVQTIERDGRDKLLYAFLEWKNGKKTKVDIEKAYKKCPMKMLKFYEKHLVFKES